MLKALIVIVGRISCCQVPEPEAGSQRSAPAKTRIRITPSQNDGIEMASSATQRRQRIGQSAPAGRRQHAQRQADQRRQHHAGGGQQQRGRQPPEHQRQRRRAVAERLAQVAR